MVCAVFLRANGIPCMQLWSQYSRRIQIAPKIGGVWAVPTYNITSPGGNANGRKARMGPPDKFQLFEFKEISAG